MFERPYMFPTALHVVKGGTRQKTTPTRPPFLMLSPPFYLVKAWRARVVNNFSSNFSSTLNTMTSHHIQVKISFIILADIFEFYLEYGFCNSAVSAVSAGILHVVPAA